jgi:hypothetical protein
VVNPIPFHDEEAEAVPVKEESAEDGQDTPVEVCIVNDAAKEDHTETSEV